MISPRTQVQLAVCMVVEFLSLSLSLFHERICVMMVAAPQEHMGPPLQGLFDHDIISSVLILGWTCYARRSVRI